MQFLKVHLLLGTLLIAATVHAQASEIRRAAHQRTIEIDARSAGVHETAPPPIIGVGDCDDTNAGIFPGQTELVGNGVDDDCDGLADEDVNNIPSNDISDSDGDGVTLQSGDCNDHNAAVHPGATEVVGNFIDDNCNGVADEDAFGNPSSDTADHDQDGYVIAPDSIFISGFDGPAR